MIREAARALAIATVLVLVLDVGLQLALSMIVVADATTAWLTTKLYLRTAWVIMATLLWLIVPRLPWAEAIDRSTTAGRGATVRAVGGALIAVSIAWLFATTAVLLLSIALRSEWTTRGRLFLDSYFYSNAIIETAPWVLAGAVLLALSPHLD